MCTPLLLPQNRQIYEHNEAALFMDHSGMLVMLPFDLRVRLGTPWGRPDTMSGHGRVTLSHHFSPSAHILNTTSRKHIVEGVIGVRASLELPNV